MSASSTTPHRSLRSSKGAANAFGGKAINDLAVLETSLSLDTQDIRSLDPYDGPRTETAVANLLAQVQDLLKILVQDFQKRGLGRALDDVEKICLLLDPRFKSLCTAVCLNGGNSLQNEVHALVEYKFSSFSGNATFSARSVGTGSSGDGQGARGPQAGEGSAEGTGGGSGGTGTEAGLPPAMFRMDKIRADMNKNVARPAGDVDAPELRKDAALGEIAVYMKEAAPKNDSKFDFLQYCEARGTGGVDPSGKVVVPARWPHIGLLVRLYAGIDTTSCQAERNFSALKQVLGDMRAGTLAHKTEKMLLLRLNRPLIPDLRG